MATIYEDETLNDKIFTALLRAGKNAEDSDVKAVRGELRDAYGEDDWITDADEIATRIRIEVLARTA